MFMGLLAAMTATCISTQVGNITLESAEPGTWQFTTHVRTCPDGTEELSIGLKSPTPAVPPKFSVRFGVPQLDALHRWKGGDHVDLPADWASPYCSRLSSGMPLVALINDNDRNRLLVAVSEVKRLVKINSGLHEEDCSFVWKIGFFDEPEAPLSAYEVTLRIDKRDVFFGDAIRAGTAWLEKTAKLAIASVPDSAFDPLYSSWYSFHQNMSADAVEAECREAARMGMKAIIVDDGWQTDDNSRGYAFCGDWQVSTRRFPDFAAHIEKVHALGMKYLIWYSVPFVGVKSANYARFKDKFLYMRGNLNTGVLDPRFPEVREFLCGIYAEAMRKWKLDGLKLDFIDCFVFQGADPAVKQNYAGRDVKSLPEAVDRLMIEVSAAIRAVKPDALIEFRQSYIGPAIRQYGNMLRAGDCPGDALANRVRTANLRLTSGRSAVHADMLEWNAAETTENAARFVLSSMFSVIQYSVMLRTIPEAHKRMIAHWLGFSQRHRNALLHGDFRPHHFEAHYPWLEGEDATERIVGVYVADTVLPLGAITKPTYVLNGTGVGEVIVRLDGAAQAEVFDTFGVSQGVRTLAAGLNAVNMPVSGYLKISK